MSFHVLHNIHYTFPPNRRKRSTNLLQSISREQQDTDYAGLLATFRSSRFSSASPHMSQGTQAVSILKTNHATHHRTSKYTYWPSDKVTCFCPSLTKLGSVQKVFF